MSFLSQRKVAFPAYSLLSDTHCLKALACIFLSLTISPEPGTIEKVLTLKGKGKPKSKHMFHHISLEEKSSKTRFVWKILGCRGYTNWVSTWVLDLGDKVSVFFLVGPIAGRPSNCLKIHPIAVFSLLTALRLVHPLGFLKEAGGLQLITACHFRWNVTSTR